MKKLLTLALSLALTATVGVASANTKLTVGASATPHAEILEAAKPILAEKGIDLEIVIFDDYVQPNLQLEAGDLDANYFQHIPYLENFNAENGTHLVSAGAVHYEPMGLYVNPAKSIALDSIPDGATISCGTILGYSAMSGAIGGGGLGQIAISYGYNRYQTDVLFVTVALLIVLMQVIQIVGMKISRKTDKRVRN